jgi:hypothetical protein
MTDVANLVTFLQNLGFSGADLTNLSSKLTGTTPYTLTGVGSASKLTNLGSSGLNGLNALGNLTSLTLNNITGLLGKSAPSVPATFPASLSKLDITGNKLCVDKADVAKLTGISTIITSDANAVVKDDTHNCLCGGTPGAPGLDFPSVLCSNAELVSHTCAVTTCSNAVTPAPTAPAPTAAEASPPPPPPPVAAAVEAVVVPQGACVICYDEPVSVTLVHANETSHLCVCVGCSDRLKAISAPCPVCREGIICHLKSMFKTGQVMH